MAECPPCHLRRSTMRHFAPTFGACPANPRVVRAGFAPGQQSADLALCPKQSMLWSTPHQQELAGVPVSACQPDRRAMKVAAQNGGIMIENITFRIPPPSPKKGKGKKMEKKSPTGNSNLLIAKQCTQCFRTLSHSCSAVRGRKYEVYII